MTREDAVVIGACLFGLVGLIGMVAVTLYEWRHA